MKRLPFVNSIVTLSIVFLLCTPNIGQATTYYVNQNHPSASNTNPGTENLPWLTISHAAETMIPGDIVYIKAGTYQERVVPQNSGSVDNYIVYAAYPTDTVTIDGASISLPSDWGGLFDVSDKHYIKISGLRIINAGPNDNNVGILVDNSSHIIIEKNYAYNTVSSGIGVWDSNYITIDGNEVKLACNDGEQECITVAGTDIFEIKDNHVHDGGPGTLGGEGIDVKDGSSNGKVYKNNVHHINRLGIYVDAWDKHTHHIEVFQNIVHDCIGDGFCVVSEKGGLLENITFYNNIAYNNEYCGFTFGHYGEPSPLRPIRNIRLINNTFYNNGKGTWGGGVSVESPDAENITIRNNICSQNLLFQIQVEVAIPNLTVDHNLIDGYRGYEKEIYGNYYIEGNPMFANPSEADFHIQRDSPAIDNGSSINAPNDDYDSNLRPQGTGYDIGAYEYQYSSITPDIKVNGSDGPITLDPSDTLSVTVALDNNGTTDNADWWLVANTPFGIWFFTFENWTDSWQPVYQGPLFSLDTYEVFCTPVSRLPAGTYTFSFGVDTDMDGNITWNSMYYDTAIVNRTKENPLPLSQIKYWAYQIQDISGPGAVDELAHSHYDMLVLEPTRTDWSSDDKYFDTKGMVERLQNTKASDYVHRKLIIAYIDIGEAENWRWYWTWSKEWPEGEPRPQDWPDYILAHDPEGWEGNFLVAYWDERWKDIVIYGRNQDSEPYGDYNSVIDETIKDGFDGIYLDWVEGFENDAVIEEAQRQGKDPAVEMIHFIQEMRNYATQRVPHFLIIQQNAVALANGHPELGSKIDAISQEAIWYDGTAYDDWNATDGYDIPNHPSLTNYYINYLDQYKAAGIPVFNCEYAVNFAAEAYNKSHDKGYIPYCTRRALSRLTTTPPPGYFKRNDGAYQVDISQSGSLQNPAWSPNGNKIAFEPYP